MAFDDKTRRTLFKTVTACRNLLTEDFDEQLRGRFGIYADEGRVLEIDRLPSLNDTERETARILRERIDHLAASKTKQGISDAVHRIRREQAFTVLNRFAALRMAEERGVIRPSVGSGFNSNGFQIFERAAGGEQAAASDRYLVYLDCLFDELSLDLGVLFDRTDAMGLLFPSENGLRDLFAELNSKDVAHLWAEDETIGWIYQYYNTDAERKEARYDETGKPKAPQNSRELAIRNQFFTPRYVVEFLTENTLGRIWYEMTRGQTRLVDHCRYLVRRPTEIFLAEGEATPETPNQKDLSQEELIKQPVHILYRPLKDPREIRLLDPACGSMHFGLYAFDLFEVIYEEAWDHGSCPALRVAYPSKDEFIKDVPRLIIEHNIHGVDIDPRAVQIAGLSLWLRAQKAWEMQRIKPADRPQVRRSNIVCAEPMPGSLEMLEDFVATLDPPLLGKLVKTIFDKMQLAGEAGSLLKIEEEIRSAIDTARMEWFKQQDDLLTRKDSSHEEFFDTAEQQVMDALRAYAEQADADSYQRRLFVDDASRGFAFIDLCRKPYDAVVMNPPFGDVADGTKTYIDSVYDAQPDNLLCSFVERARLISHCGYIGAITDSTWLKKADYESFRDFMLKGETGLSYLADLGWGVLDGANVATCAFIAGGASKSYLINAVRLVDAVVEKKPFNLIDWCQSRDVSETIIRPLDFFSAFPRKAIAYETPGALVLPFTNWSRLEPDFAQTRRGYTPGDTFRFFGCWWEVPSSEIGGSWRRLNNGGAFSPFISDGFYVAFNEEGWGSYRSLKGFRLESEEWFGVSGIGWGKRTDYMYAFPLPQGSMFSNEGHCAFPIQDQYRWPLIAYLNSQAGQSLLNLFCGQHKQAGYVKDLPTPDLKSEALSAAGEIAKEMHLMLRDIDCHLETSEWFLLPSRIGERGVEFKKRLARVSVCYGEKLTKIDTRIAETLSISLDETIPERVRNAVIERLVKENWGSATFGYAVGAMLGRWDIRYATGERQSPELPDPFDPLPVCPPGMLQNPDGLPAESKDVPVDYPLRISWPGILVDDENHPDDIVARVRGALELIWKDHAEAIEAEACEILEVKAKPKENLDALRVYLRDPNRFFNDHLARYSKSRRKSPIYWPLSTDSGSYTLWVYYHRLNRQTLFTCIEMIELKREELGREIESLGSRTDTGGTAEERQKVEDQAAFLAELKTLRDRLLEVTKLPYHPNLNDGVQITAAPLWQCFRHSAWQKVLKETWSELTKGEYDWAHLSMSIWPDRVVLKCAKDHGLAIAHGIDDLLWVPDLSSKKKDQHRPLKSPDEELKLLKQAGHSKDDLDKAAEDVIAAEKSGLRAHLWIEQPPGIWRRRKSPKEEIENEIARRKER
jgi:hypothetical protein